MNKIDLDKIIDKMETLGFKHVNGLTFEDDYYDDEINIENVDIDIGESYKEKYKVNIEEDNKIVVNIPDEELMSAKKVMNGSNPDSVDAHPFALLYIKGNSNTKNNIKKAVSDEQFWQQRHSVKNNSQLFEYEDFDIVLDTNLN